MATCFLKLNVKIKMKNKPYRALLSTSYLSNEIRKGTQKSHDPIPLIRKQSLPAGYSDVGDGDYEHWYDVVNH
jgi:hypothetical protein